VARKFVKFVKRKVDGPEAQESGRYTLNLFGIKNGTADPDLLQEAQEKGTLHVEYYGADGQWHALTPSQCLAGEQKVPRRAIDHATCSAPLHRAGK